LRRPAKRVARVALWLPSSFSLKLFNSLS
jgi:hypothetical protein